MLSTRLRRDGERWVAETSGESACTLECRGGAGRSIDLSRALSRRCAIAGWVVLSVGSVRIGDVSGASHPVSTGASMEVLFRRSMGGALTEWEGLSREAAELRPEPVNLSNRLRESRSVRGLQSP